jgi:hydroxymethylbilane synthase
MQNISQQLKQNSLQSNDSMSLRRNNGNNGIDNDIIDVIIGSRKSQLALIQTQSIIKLLTDFYGNKYNFIIKTMNTTGDNIIDIPLSKIGEKALFTRELEEELIDNKIDFIVHSLKDLPTNLPNGCVIALITK